MTRNVAKLAIDERELEILLKLPTTTLAKVGEVKDVFGKSSRVVDFRMPPEPRDPLLDTALEHHKASRAVVSITRDKVPTVKGWNRWFREQQTERQVKELFSNGANGIAILTWPATDFAVLDFDGEHAVEAWKQTNIELPDTARNFTPSGGVHLIFKLDDATGLSRKVRIVKAGCDCTKSCGVDFLINGFFIVPPTRGYREDPDAPFENFAVLPREVIALAQEKPQQEKRITGDAAGRVHHGERTVTACSLAGTMRARGMSIEAVGVALRADNEARFDPPLNDREIEKVLKSAAKWAPGTAERNRNLDETNKESLIVTMDEIKAEKVDWPWTNRIPFGWITLIDGDPGAGKSYLSLAVASAVSTGESLPFDQKKKSPSGVLLMSCEDGYGDTVRPHLDQLGADVMRIAIPNPGRGLATTMLNASFIEDAVKIQRPALVIVDPVIAFAGRKNTDKANDVRELLSPLMGIAEKYALACLVIRHFTKQADTKAMYRGSGSIDFMAACRSAFIIVESEDEPNMRVLAQVKNSLGPKSASVSFYIDESGFRWGKQVDSDAETLLAANKNGGRARERVQLDSAQKFLTDLLSNGPVASNSVRDKADKAGMAWRTVWRAKEALNVKASKERGTGEWFWRLPRCDWNT